ncbi:MAG TPA: response regulator transcription factor [Candidatus Enterosoma merdigallinarum]|nr:response regulator transcription factor [Candidatus Enterosoma merdigallinarum]
MANLIYSVEDDINISKIIALTLKKQGYEVLSFSDGSSFLETFSKRKPDLVLLDLMLPDIDGFDILRKLRADKDNDDIEIMIVSAKSQIVDKVDGLDLGADDYLEKPFDILELISRVNAKFRRNKKTSRISIDQVTVDFERRTCQVAGDEVALTNAEFTILYELMKASDKVVSRDSLLNVLWGDKDSYESRTIDVHVRSLRTKLKAQGKHIVSVYGIGYRYTK